MAGSDGDTKSRDRQTLTYVVIGMLGLVTSTSLLALGITSVAVVQGHKLVDADGATTTDDPFGLALLLAELAYVVLFLVTGVVYVVWLHGAYKNLHAPEHVLLDHTPGWAVGWWFVAIANLVEPYQVVTGLWEESVSTAITPQAG